MCKYDNLERAPLSGLNPDNNYIEEWYDSASAVVFTLQGPTRSTAQSWTTQCEIDFELYVGDSDTPFTDDAEKILFANPQLTIAARDSSDSDFDRTIRVVATNKLNGQEIYSKKVNLKSTKISCTITLA